MIISFKGKQSKITGFYRLEKIERWMYYSRMIGQKLSNKAVEAAEASVFISLSKLKKRNIHLGTKKTSVTLEPLVWELLHETAEEQKCHVNELCEFIYERKNKEASLASAIRIFVMAYMNIQIKARG